MPAGTVRVYQADSKGQLQFVGEDHISHTPKDETLNLYIGNAFDVTAERKQTDFETLGQNVYETAFEITIRNHKKQPIIVEVNEPVGGQWTVPSPNTKSDGGFWASEWVGIDGWNSSDVLQAGTETQVTRIWFITSRQVYTWWEWFPAGEVRISNLPVAAGDLIYCLICADSTTHATVYYSNQSEGVGTRFDITAPSKTTLTGNVAEWIVERPTVGGSVASLTDYAACYFDECIAGGSGSIDNLAGASLITIGSRAKGASSDLKYFALPVTLRGIAGA